MRDDNPHCIRLLDTVDRFCRIKAYSGVAPRRMFLLDEDLVDSLVQDRLLEVKDVLHGPHGVMVQGVSLTAEGRRRMCSPR